MSVPRDNSRLHMRVGNDRHSVKAKQFARDLPDDFLSLKSRLEQKKIAFYCLISCNKSQLYKIFSIEKNKKYLFFIQCGECYARCDWLLPITYQSTDAWMTF